MLKKCEECGRFFGAESESQTLCQACRPIENTVSGSNENLEARKLRMARNIVSENPNIMPEQLIKEMAERDIEISLKEIMRYVEKDYMILKINSNQYFCEDCGKKILSGRLCPTCTKRFEKKIAKKPALPTEEPEVLKKKIGSGMHYKG